jgi:hypothetical protein
MLLLRGVVGICLLVLASGRGWGQIVPSAAERGSERQPLLLRDFKPQSMLHAPAHQIQFALKFYF